MAEADHHPDRGALVTCWLVLSLTAAATVVCIFVWDPWVGLPKFPGDGSLLIIAGIGIAGLSVLALLLLVPARKTAPLAAPKLWLFTRISATALSGYVLYVAYMLYALSQATDL